MFASRGDDKLSQLIRDLSRTSADYNNQLVLIVSLLKTMNMLARLFEEIFRKLVRVLVLGT